MSSFVICCGRASSPESGGKVCGEGNFINVVGRWRGELRERGKHHISEEFGDTGLRSHQGVGRPRHKQRFSAMKFTTATCQRDGFLFLLLLCFTASLLLPFFPFSFSNFAPTKFLETTIPRSCWGASTEGSFGFFDAMGFFFCFFS